METTVKNIGLLFMGILLIVIWSFYHTFLGCLPRSAEAILRNMYMKLLFIMVFSAFGTTHFNPVQKFAASKALKGFSYLLAPLVMFAIYYVAKAQYLQDVIQMDENEAIARQTLALPTIFAFGALCVLAMLNKENHFNYIRHTIAATLLLVGLGLSHAFVVYIHFPFSMGVSLSFIITDLVLLTLMINDKIYGHTIKPYLFSLAIVLATHLVWFCLPNTIAWQDVAGKFVQLFFNM